MLMLFAAVVAAIVSCRDDGRARGVLSLADSLMEERADSSLALLRRDSLLFEDAGKDVRMAYVLLRTEAEDKCYVTHTSDSTMLPAAKYFAAHGTPLQSVRAWYVLGRVYCDLRLYGHALTAFDNAIAVNAGGDPAACRYKSRACTWAGDVYEKKDLHDEALRYNKRAYQYARKSDVPTVEVYTLRDIGRSYSGLKRNDVAIPYYQRAAVRAMALGDSVLYNMLAGELATVYIEEGMLADARRALSNLPYSEVKENIAAHYFTWAEYYEAVGRLDSAMEYNLRGMDYASEYINRDICRDLARISLKQGKRGEAMRYCDLYFTYADSLKDDEAAEYDNLLSYMERMLGIERDNVALADDKARLVIWLSVVVFVVLVAAFVIIRYFLNVRRRAREQHERVKKYLRRRHEREMQGVKRNSERIRQLEGELASSGKRQSELRNSLMRNEAEMLELRNKLMAFERQHSELLAADFAETEEYKLFHDPTARPTSADYHRLVASLDRTYENFTQRLKDFYPGISENEIWICCMVKTGLTSKEVCLKSVYTKYSLSMAKHRLYAKMFNKKGSSKDLDKFIKDF